MVPNFAQRFGEGAALTIISELQGITAPLSTPEAAEPHAP